MAEVLDVNSQYSYLRTLFLKTNKKQLLIFKLVNLFSAASGLGPLGVWSPEHVASVTVALIQSNCGMWGWHGGILVPPPPGIKPHSLHWKADSLPQDYQRRSHPFCFLP